MEKTKKERQKRSGGDGGGGIWELDDYVLENILTKLPAKDLASAACVSHSWNSISSRILSRPTFFSLLSLNTSLPEAVNEVTSKVLSAPIRPHFGILTISSSFNIDRAHALVVEKLGSRIPIITCEAAGVIGRDALTHQFSEVKFLHFDDDCMNPCTTGISLTVGYFPGLKVDAIPLSDVQQFVMDVRSFSASVSGCTSPAGIIMFGDSHADMKPVLEKLDCAFSEQTIIAGNESCSFRHSTHREHVKSYKYAVALVFAREITTLNGQGKIEFHFAVGTGVSAVGPIYRVISAKKRSRDFTTWLTAKREGENVILDGEQMLNDLEEEVEDPIPSYDLYVGVSKRRKYAIGSEQVKTVTSLNFHNVQEADEQYLYVGGGDIKTGDTFRFYIPSIDEALDKGGIVSENFSKLKHKEMIGGFVFACCGRGESFFRKPNVDSSPILDNFADIPVGGMYCDGEIGRGSPNLVLREKGLMNNCLHVYSSIYLLVSYDSPSKP